MATPEEQKQIDALRDLLGERVENNDQSESLFSDEKLLEYLRTEFSINAAALQGWKVKMAHFANLVNITDGASAREMGQLFEHAQQMVRTYTNLAKSATYGRSRSGRIVRS